MKVAMVEQLVVVAAVEVTVRLEYMRRHSLNPHNSQLIFRLNLCQSHIYLIHRRPRR
jgi:hypothetical protein